jgi:GntR family transcriptional regulator
MRNEPLHASIDAARIGQSMVLTEGPLPLYFQVVQHIEEAIRSGKLKPGAALPTEERLGEQFGVSRITIRRALEHLLADRLVVRRRGVGTFVAEPSTSQKAVSMVGSLHDALHYVRGLRYSRLSKKQMPASAKVANALQLEAGTAVVFAETLGMVDDGALVHTNLYFPTDIGELVSAVDFKAGTPVIRILERKLGQRCVRAEQLIEAEIADAAVAKALGIKPRTPIIVVNRTYYTAAGRPIEFVVARYHPERFKLHLELVENPGRQKFSLS